MADGTHDEIELERLEFTLGDGTRRPATDLEKAAWRIGFDSGKAERDAARARAEKAECERDEARAEAKTRV